MAMSVSRITCPEPQEDRHSRSHPCQDDHDDHVQYSVVYIMATEVRELRLQRRTRLLTA